MSDELIRVSYEFPDRSEVAFVERVPFEGSVVRHYGTRWHVETVDIDTTGGYTVCLRPVRPRARASDAMRR